ncbi:hypothetical protein RSSM_03430 [Rhodopirellula sallentina SM41]|uniref:Uncharacterized protein n=1 Tax=Rhodopirellula sallentina SM41 TaxID=1263870 RepID=M5UB79_9BACT|nr:hypothetical protein RSSM_03430 [Rhodopirellula sallentina SM41]
MAPVYCPCGIFIELLSGGSLIANTSLLEDARKLASLGYELKEMHHLRQSNWRDVKKRNVNNKNAQFGSKLNVSKPSENSISARKWN